MKRITLLMALALVVALSVPAAAEVEEITVGGSIVVQSEVQTPGFDLTGSLTRGSIGFDDDISTDAFYTQRTRVNVDAKLSGGVRGFVELQVYDYWGENDIQLNVPNFTTVPPSLDVETIDDTLRMYQAFMDIGDIADYPAMVRVGRQELVYGRKWLVGNNDAGRVFNGLSFDAIKASYSDDMLQVDAWGSKIAESNALWQNATATAGKADPSDRDVDFYGVYGTYKGVEGMAIDGYWLFLRDPTVVTPGGDTWALHTIGARVGGAWDVAGYTPDALDYNLEVAYQFGDASEGAVDGDFDALAINALLGYTFNDVDYMPRLEGEYAYFSGDDDPTDGDIERFDRLFSDVHYGLLNLGGVFDAGTTNLHIFRGGVSAVPMEKLTVAADILYFMLAEDEGTVFGFQQPAGLDDDDPGWELDLWADYQYTEDLNISAGWAHFFVGDATENTWGGGEDDDVDYFYVKASLDF